jgi:glycosyltransferase involved in cell wall biosynthesis
VHNDPPFQDRVTYLIANHNRAAYLGDCLESLRRQTDPGWLALIVDDASTDRSIAVIRAFDDQRVRLLVNDRNHGYIATLERLLTEARTDIVAILDADDALAPEATERLRDAYASHPRAGFVYSRFATYDETLAVARGVHGAAIPEGSTALRDGMVGHIRSFRRSMYYRTAGLDDRMLYAEDRDLVYKLEEVTRPVFVDAVLYRYREVPGSQSRDPVKREIGAGNTRRARREALHRRGIAGFRKARYEAYFVADYLAYSHRPPRVVRVLARGLSRPLRLLAPAVDPLVGRGDVRRPSLA